MTMQIIVYKPIRIINLNICIYTFKYCSVFGDKIHLRHLINKYDLKMNVLQAKGNS